MQSPLRVHLAQFEGATTMRVLPLAVGLLAAAVRRSPELGISDIPIVHTRRPTDESASALASADVVGVSLYTWNEQYSLEVVRRAKALRPEIVVVAGGPSAPRRAPDATSFLLRHPEIDALVAGEGERTFVEILGAVQRGTSLAGIPGVSTRCGETVSVTPRGPRLLGPDFIDAGSPYLDGTFDHLLARGERPIQAIVLETNRGCPFSCAFCDWGQATESRVHEVPLERVHAEFRWAAERKVPYVYIVDANFGIRPRDIELVRYLGALRAEFFFPQFVYFHLTKNATEKNLATVEALRAAGIGTQVSLSMQDFDASVLDAIQRDNIRPERALALRERAHGQGIPTTNELLLGLPAQTLASFRRSLTSALTPFPADSFYLYTTRILVNAEMASAAYREKWGLVTRMVPSPPRDAGDEPFVVEREEIIVGSASMTVEEWRAAFATGFLLAALVNLRLLPTTVHVLQYAIGGDPMVLIDALLRAETPRLAAIRAGLLRFADATVEEVGIALPVTGFGDARRDVTEAVTACVVEDVDLFGVEVAAVCAAILPGHARMLRDVVAWDMFSLPARGADGGEQHFEWDWPAYVGQQASCPAPRARAVVVLRTTPWWVSTPDAAAYLDAMLAAGWAKQSRVSLAVSNGVTVGGTS